MSENTDTPLSGLPSLSLPVQNTDIFLAVRGNKSFRVDLVDLVPMLVTTVEISSAEILDLFTTPKVIITAQGAGTFINPIFGIIKNNGDGGINYVFGGSLELGNSAGTTTLFEFSNTVLTASSLSMVNGQSNPEMYDEDDSLVLRASGVNPTTGDRTFEVTVWYTVET